MFKKDIRALKSEAIQALDLLQLCLDLEDQINYDPQSTHSQKTLTYLAKSPLLLKKFIEWLETQSNKEQSIPFSLSRELTYEFPKSKYFEKHQLKLSEVKKYIQLPFLYENLKSIIINDLHQWLTILHIHKKDIKQQTLLAQLTHKFYKKLLKEVNQTDFHISKTQTETIKHVLKNALIEGFTFLTQKIKRVINQNFGYRGVMNFILDVQNKFSIYSLLQLERGIHGDNLFKLNTHVKTCTQFSTAFVKLYREEQNSSQTIFPNHFVPFNYLQELGSALLMVNFPDISHEILENFKAHQSKSEQHINIKDYDKIEKEVLKNYQIKEILHYLKKVKHPVTFKHLKNTEDQPIELSESINFVANEFVAQCLPNTNYKDQNLFIKEVCCLLDPLNPDNFLIIKNRGQIACHYLTHRKDKRELVSGAYNKYINFIHHFHHEDISESTSLEALLIKWCKQQTNHLATITKFSVPSFHLNIENEEVKILEIKLQEKLHLTSHVFNQIKKKCLELVKKNNLKNYTIINTESNDINAFFSHQFLKENYYHQLSSFFQKSKYFTTGFTKFYQWSQKISTKFNHSIRDKEYDFFSDLEIDLRKFCKVVDVKVKPRVLSKTENNQDYFSLLFEEYEFKNDFYCKHFRHLIADIYIFDEDYTKIFHPEYQKFIDYLFNYLLIHHSQDLWEQLKANSEIARKDISHKIQTLLPKNQLNTALIPFKAKLLDELFPHFSTETEQANINNIHFGFTNSSTPFQIIETEDFNYWNKCNNNNYYKPCQLSKLEGQLKSIVEKEPIPENYKALDNSYILFKFLEFNDTDNACLWIYIKNSRPDRSCHILENFQDKGYQHELSTCEITQNLPIGLWLLQTFNSDTSFKALSRLTHLRPSILKEFGHLLSQLNKEMIFLLPKCSPDLKKEFKSFLDSCVLFWKENEQELSSDLRLTKNTLSKMNNLRNQSENLKKLCRLKIQDLADIIEYLKKFNSKFQIIQPQIYLNLGSEDIYLSLQDFQKFKQKLKDIPGKSNSKYEVLKNAIEKLETTWFISDKNWLQEGFQNYLEELSLEEHHKNNYKKTKVTFTIFYYEDPLPEQHKSNFPSIGVECFSEAPTSDHAHQKIVKSSGVGYDTIFKTYFHEYSAIAHRNVCLSKNSDPYMECFFRLKSDEASTYPISINMLKQRFNSSSGISTILFFPCKDSNLKKKMIHNF